MRDSASRELGAGERASSAPRTAGRSALGSAGTPLPMEEAVFDEHMLLVWNVNHSLIFLPASPFERLLLVCRDSLSAFFSRNRSTSSQEVPALQEWHTGRNCGSVKPSCRPSAVIPRRRNRNHIKIVTGKVTGRLKSHKCLEVLLLAWSGLFSSCSRNSLLCSASTPHNKVLIQD